ncbi:MAG: hypothetical protein ABF244_00495 [Flavobacteriaceae bacterium]
MEKEKSIDDINELNDIQNNLVDKSEGKFLKSNKPKDAKYTRMTLTRNMAICLVFVYKHYKYGDGVKETDYFPKRILLQYLKSFPNVTKNFARLKHWDLIAPMPTSPTEVIYRKGWYGLTENGIAFIQKEIALPKYAYVWNGFAYEHKPIPVMITDLINELELNELLKI